MLLFGHHQFDNGFDIFSTLPLVVHVLHLPTAEASITFILKGKANFINLNLNYKIVPIIFLTAIKTNCFSISMKRT